MPHSATIDQEAHPAPHRDRVSAAVLAFILFGPPLAWSCHLALNYGLASEACYPGSGPMNSPSIGALRLVLIAVDLASFVISAAAALLAYRYWTASARELAHSQSALVDTGEGRTRFLAIWGLLIGIGFFATVFFDFVGLWILPICA